MRTMLLGQQIESLLAFDGARGGRGAPGAGGRPTCGICPRGRGWSLQSLETLRGNHGLFLHPQAALRRPASRPRGPGEGVAVKATAPAGEGGAAVPGAWG